MAEAEGVEARGGAVFWGGWWLWIFIIIFIVLIFTCWC